MVGDRVGLQPVLYGWWQYRFTANFIWLVIVQVYSQFYMVGDCAGLQPILYGWWLCRFRASFIWLVTVQVYSQFYMVGDCAGLEPVLYGWWLCRFRASFIWLVTVQVYSCGSPSLTPCRSGPSPTPTTAPTSCLAQMTPKCMYVCDIRIDLLVWVCFGGGGVGVGQGEECC